MSTYPNAQENVDVGDTMFKYLAEAGRIKEYGSI